MKRSARIFTWLYRIREPSYPTPQLRVTQVLVTQLKDKELALDNKIIHRIASEMKGKGYAFDFHQTDNNRAYLISRADVDIGGIQYPCDTYIEFEHGISYMPRRVAFTTFLYHALIGRKHEMFDRFIDSINYNYPGKIAYIQMSEGYGLFYITNERIDVYEDLTDLFVENIEHHAVVKAQLMPVIERIHKQLGLKPKMIQNSADKFAQTWYDVLSQNKLQNNDSITYLVEEKQNI